MNTTQKHEKGYEGHEFSYSSPHDSVFKKLVIKTVKLLSGRNYLQKIHDDIHADNPTAVNVWGKALKRLNISIDCNEEMLDKVPAEGPVIFVANHPFGVVDGAIFCHLATRKRPDFFVLVNEVLSQEPILKEHLLPIDFRTTSDAIKTNLETRRLTIERLNNGEALIIFPSGAVATARRPFGNAVEFPWRRFICKRIHETKCTVVPLYFHGQNSWLFHMVSWVSENMRLGLLLGEVLNKRGKTIKVQIGEPLSYDQLEGFKDKQKMIEFLQNHTMSLASE